MQFFDFDHTTVPVEVGWFTYVAPTNICDETVCSRHARLFLRIY